ncbi:MAG: phospholipase [Geobacteraceae bacterium]|nr:phospholipase [Geobacteraceae bacterium]
MRLDTRYCIPSRRGLSRACALLFALALLCAAAVPAPARETHPARATLLKNREYGEALLHGIRTARSTILVSCYLFKITRFPGNLPRRIAEELIEARRRGVAVTVIFEQSRETDDSLNRENRSTATLLSRNGVTVRFDSLTTTTHAKAVIIDGRYVFLGSHNLTHSALTRNNELSVLLDSPEAAREAANYFGEI